MFTWKRSVILNIFVISQISFAQENYIPNFPNKNNVQIKLPKVKPKYQINCGGDTAGSFAKDNFFNGGSTFSNTNGIDDGDVKNGPPQQVYQSYRYGNFVYTFPDLTPGG